MHRCHLETAWKWILDGVVSYVVFFDNFGHFGQQEGGENVSALSFSSLAILRGLAPQISIPASPQNRALLLQKSCGIKLHRDIFLLNKKGKKKYVFFTSELKMSLFWNQPEDPLLSFYLSYFFLPSFVDSLSCRHQTGSKLLRVQQELIIN